MKDLLYYQQKFSALHCFHKNGVPSPHKAIMLLTVMEGARQGAIVSGVVRPSRWLEATFLDIWHSTGPHAIGVNPSWNNPFWHLQNEEFWTVKSSENSTLTHTPSKQQIIAQGMIALVDSDLWNLMLDPPSAAQLQKVLVDTYLQHPPHWP